MLVEDVRSQGERGPDGPTEPEGGISAVAGVEVVVNAQGGTPWRRQGQVDESFLRGTPIHTVRISQGGVARRSGQTAEGSRDLERKVDLVHVTEVRLVVGPDDGGERTVA